jgi:hypothetical protein
VRFLALLIVVLVVGCSSAAPALTGIGASRDQWHKHHGAGYADVLTDSKGHVDGYVLTMTPRSLAAAEAVVRADLPADTTAGTARLTVGIEGTKCEIVGYSSPTLRHVLGSAAVTAVFQTAAAITMDTSRITHAVVSSAITGLPQQC